MKESIYVSNFKDHIDCDSLISQLLLIDGDMRTTENPYGNPVNEGDSLYEAKIAMRDIWESAGYMKSDSVEWINYYPGSHFDSSVVEKFSNLTNSIPYNVWISSMMPGKCVPWHWDIIKDYNIYKDDPRMVRYTLFLDQPKIGSVFVLNDEAYHMIEQGSVFKWVKWDEWHLGFNCGLTQKFLFHYIGFSKNLND